MAKVSEALTGLGMYWSGQGAQYERNKLEEQESAREAAILDEAKRKQQTLEDSFYIHSALANGRPDAAMSVLQQRLQRQKAAGVDTTTTMQHMKALEAGDMDSVLQDVTAVIDYANQFGGGKNAMPADIRTFEQMTQGLSDEDRERARRISLGLDPRAGISANERIATDPAMMEAILKFASGKSGAEQSGKDEEARRSQRIAWGYDASLGLPTARRAFDLLKKVETGGADAIDIKTRQALGIESADQGELANLLGKAVLSQLKATFGAQFTEKEGKLLMDIEAGIKKGQGTNMRLLSQLIKRSEVYAKRAIQDAISGQNPDYATAAAIQEQMDLDLGEGLGWLGVGGEESGPPVVRSQADFDALPSGALFIEDGKQYRKP